MGVAGWRFAHMKRSLGGRAAIVAVLEEWPVICSVAVAAGSMIMIGITLYNDWPQWHPLCGRPVQLELIEDAAEGVMRPESHGLMRAKTRTSAIPTCRTYNVAARLS